MVEAADLLIANTDLEAKQLMNLYGADPDRVEVVHPGVDLSVFRPQDKAVVRRRLGLPEDAIVLMFAGRIQPLKAPDVLLRAVSVLLDRDPSLRSRLVVPIVGGPSGTGLEHPESLAQLSRRARASTTWCASCRRWPSRSWPAGALPRQRSPYRPTTSRSAWWPRRPRRPEPPSSPLPSAA